MAKQFWVLAWTVLVFLSGCSGEVPLTQTQGITLQVYSADDTSFATPVQSVSSNKQAVVKIRYLDDKKQPKANSVLTITVSGGTASSETVTLNSNGEGYVSISPPEVQANFTTTAVQVTVTDGAITELVSFAFVPVTEATDTTTPALDTVISSTNTIGITLTKTSDGQVSSTINSNDSGSITLTLLDNNGAPVADTPIELSTSLGSFDAGAVTTLISGLTDQNGQLTGQKLYAPATIAGTQVAGVLSVTALNTTVTKDFQFSKVVDVNAVASIEFVSVSPAVIFVAGSGGVQNALLSYKVLDVFGSPSANVTVNFALLTNLGSAKLSATSAVTNTSGVASVWVQSGSESGPVSVEATLTTAAGNLRVVSSELTITTGIPVQTNFALTANVRNPEAFDYNGEQVVISATLLDQLGNAVKPGTVVNFATETGGSIGASCQTDAQGHCSVTWQSEGVAVKPTDHRVTILAWAVGSEGFIDANGSGYYESSDGEPFRNGTSSGLDRVFQDNGTGKLALQDAVPANQFSEPFVDANANKQFDEPYQDVNANNRYDVGELYIDHNRNGVWNGVNALPAGEVQFVDLNGDGQYQGTGRVLSEHFVDANFDGLFTTEVFTDRTDILGYGANQFDGPYLNDANFNNAFDVGEEYTNPVDNSVISALVTRGNYYFEANGANLFQGPGFVDLSEPWLDENEDGIRQANEMFRDFNGNQAFDLQDNLLSNFLCANGDPLCSTVSETYIRKSLALVMASSNANYAIRLTTAVGACNVGDVVASNLPNIAVNCANLAIPNGGAAGFSVTVSDTANQTLPMGTTIVASADIGVLSSLNYTVGNSIANQGVTLAVSLGDDDPTDVLAPVSGTFSVLVTTPKGIITTVPISLTLD